MGLLKQARTALLALLLGTAAALGARAEGGALETAVKASYLYKFAPFVIWPARAMPAPGAPFVICVVGQDPFSSLLDRAVTGQTVAGHPITISRLAVASRDMACQIAFLGGSRAQPVKEALRVLRGAPVLTVTDAAAAPGVVDFVIADSRVRFRIDEAAATDDGLTISSKLLGLALTVTRRQASDPAP